ncbi:uroporphyrinogen decarboxylase, putative [Babesia ovata]|uniref:Uroporphyrinogen decarboxylase, putative n=1 Tax=Babesia ovata TaxID=189622 RepID=A0A2H6K8P2_9APIC|nr:uroporphyrinogen decarboxylase, putative [Babesia ovata]GBE59350.1 uroporphyrinogen decarboxylase, putative [Babesia ovata]
MRRFEFLVQIPGCLHGFVQFLCDACTAVLAHPVVGKQNRINLLPNLVGRGAESDEGEFGDELEIVVGGTIVSLVHNLLGKRLNSFLKFVIQLLDEFIAA